MDKIYTINELSMGIKMITVENKLHNLRNVC